MNDTQALRRMPARIFVPAGKLNTAVLGQMNEGRRLERMGLLKLTPETQSRQHPGYYLDVTVTALGEQVLREGPR